MASDLDLADQEAIPDQHIPERCEVAIRPVPIQGQLEWLMLRRNQLPC
jgi:hypothetical protein